MGPDPDTDHAPSDSHPDDDVYTRNEEGEPRMAGPSGEGEGRYQFYRDGGFRVVDPKVYGAAILVGVLLVLFPEPITSFIGVVLVVLGAVVAAVDVLS